MLFSLGTKKRTILRDWIDHALKKHHQAALPPAATAELIALAKQKLAEDAAASSRSEPLEAEASLPTQIESALKRHQQNALPLTVSGEHIERARNLINNEKSANCVLFKEQNPPMIAQESSSPQPEVKQSTAQ